MDQFISKLGIDWRLLLSQTVNFLILLAVLRAFAYKPLLKILKDRKAKIEEGLEKAKEADTKLHEVSLIAKGKIKKAEEEALGIIKTTEEKAKKLEAKLSEEARVREGEMLKSAELAAAAKREEAEHAIEQEAARLVKDALIKTVELAPEHIDEALIKKALHHTKKTA